MKCSRAKYLNGNLALEEAPAISEDRRSKEFKERDAEKREKEYQRHIGKCKWKLSG